MQRILSVAFVCLLVLSKAYMDHVNPDADPTVSVVLGSSTPPPQPSPFQLGLKAAPNSIATPDPVVLVHGIANPTSVMLYVKNKLNSMAPALKVEIASISRKWSTDAMDSVILDVYEQAALLRTYLLKNHSPGSKVQLLAHSQGGVVSRAYVSLYNSDPKAVHVSKLITMSSPHFGVSRVPFSGQSGKISDYLLKLAESMIKAHTFGNASFAGYWNSAVVEPPKSRYGYYLGLMNGISKAQPLYKRNLMKLEKFLMLCGKGDTLLIPYQTQKFEELPTGKPSGATIPLRKSQVYKSDNIGLKSLDQAGKIQILENEFDHANWLLPSVKPVLAEWIIPTLYE